MLQAYLPEHNRRFAMSAADANAAWKPRLTGYDARCVCALQHVRIVANNNTMRIENHIIDIPSAWGVATQTRVPRWWSVIGSMAGTGSTSVTK